MKHKPRILMFAILVIAALSLAACDATGAISIEDLTGATGGAAAKAEESLTNSTANQSLDTSSSSMEDSSSSPSVDFKLTGMVEAVTANSITINGVTFTVDTTEDLTTYFEAGMAYEIEYTVNPDDSISLVSFSLDSMSGSGDSYSEDDYEFYGMLEDVTANTLTFNGETYTVDTTEDLTTLFTPGESYEIEYYLNADGTITLKSYSMDDGSMGSGSGDDMSSSSDDSYSDNSYNNSYDDNSSDDSYNDSSNDNSSNSSNDSSNDSSNNNDNESEYDD